jgi:hypothetical protein
VGVYNYKTAPTVVGPVDGEGGSASGTWGRNDYGQLWTLQVGAQVADYENKQGTVAN